MTARSFALTALAALLPGLVSAQDVYRHGRVRHVEGAVTIQRASESAAEEAVPNLPFLPGDRVWTDRESRGEFQFADGTLLRIDRRTKIEYAAHEERRGTDRIALALWSGDVIVRQRDGRSGSEISIEAPGGLSVDLAEGGVYRVGLEAGETRIAVYEGEATVEGDRRVRVRAGEQLWARGAEIDEAAETVNRRDLDDFARWDEGRQGGQAWARERSEYLPDEVSVYAPELEDHGAWYYEVEVGHVWRPHVSGSWRPYSDGRWVWTAYGWTWVPNETWGWAVSHYGRWGWSARLGWYWIPSGGWGPAWVSWATSDSYVGWCPLGYRDRPVVIHERGWDRAGARGSLSGGAWTVARRGDLGARDQARRRGAAPLDAVRELRPLEGARRLSRELTVTERPVAAAPRTIRTRPGPGDTVPELRSDPATTIPAPTARRRYESEREQQEQERSQVLRRSRPRESQRGSSSGSTHEATPRTSGRSVQSGGRVEERKRDDQPGTSADQGRTRSEERDRDRDRVLGPLFRPLSRLRGNRDEGESARESGRDSGRDATRDSSRDSGRANRTRPEGAAPREAAPPRRVEPRTPPPTQPPASSSSKQGGGRAVRRDRNREE